ncbi:integrin alpha [Streptomyces sp. NBC_00882]|uniref:FG-GAP repeat protein n=1 Tax=Streptomyces sp. NBC_00882 TaxID=2975856 RepID=UPI0038656A08|nr:integrin alpha [Streptomyces sp. NBC_00882]
MSLLPADFDKDGCGDLSAGDTNGDGYQDLAVGLPYEKVGTVKDAGGVHVLRGGKSGLTGKNSQWFTRAGAGVPGARTSTRPSAPSSARATSTATATRTRWYRVPESPRPEPGN